MAKKKAARKKKAVEPRGLLPDECTDGVDDAATQLAKQVDEDGGRALTVYREPLGGRSLVLAVLPLEKIEPTPFQRDLSKTHVARLGKVIDKLDRFLDPIITVRNDEGVYWTPNGNHRLNALKDLGARAATCLIVPEKEVAYQILALNTERAHNLKEKSLEVIRMARSLAVDSDRNESDFAFEFEEPAFLTLGAAYEQRARLAGSSYKPVIGRLDGFRDEPLAVALEHRDAMARLVLDLDESVNDVVKGLKDKGFQSPYLKAFVVARCNPLRFKKSVDGIDLEGTLTTMLDKAQNFDLGKVKAEDVQSASGPPSDD